MNESTRRILLDIAQCGHAVIMTNKTRETVAAQEMILSGIIHVYAEKENYFIVKFGNGQTVV